MPNFAKVLKMELEEIRELRRRRGEDPDAGGPVGLAFSGGGIRSATFNLGVLQGLATYKLLKRIDYMSTVSGGGYIGSWLANWIKRASIDTVERQLASAPPPVPPGDLQAFSRYREPEPINFLRAYSNYLTPRIGIFGADTWASIASYLRNLLLNLAILVATLAAGLLIPRFVQATFIHTSEFGLSAGWWSLGFALLLMVWALAVVTMNIADFSVRKCEVCDPQSAQPHVDTENRAGFTAQKWVLMLAVLPTFLAASFGTYALWFFATQCKVGMEFHFWLVGGAVFYFALRLLGVLLGAVAGRLFSWTGNITCVWHMERKAACVVLGTAPFAGVLGGFLLRWIGEQFCTWTFASGPKLAGLSKVATLGPPFLVAAILLTGVLHIGLMGLWFENQRREWWARCAGWLLLGCLAWVFFFGLAIYAPVGVICLSGWVNTKATAIVAWVGSTLAGVLGGSSKKTSGRSGGNKSFEIAVTVAPYVFIVGLLVLISCGINLVVPPDVAKLPDHEATQALPPSTNINIGVTQSPSLAPFKAEISVTPAAKPADSFESKVDAYWRRWDERSAAAAGADYKETGASRSLFCRVVACWLGLVSFAIILALRVDINEFSMHLLYRNRLVRCYLGASNTERDAQRFTGFDPTDDELLAAFSTKVDPNCAGPHPYAGPYPIINTALNLTHGERLAWQERKAESFVFTPRYCGFEFQEEHPKRIALTWEESADRKPDDRKPVSQTEERKPADRKPDAKLQAGFRETACYAYPPPEKNTNQIGGVYLGTAFAISGAAASPNMGYHTSPPLAFLMTVFDVRLGWWLGNPRRRDTWQHSSPGLSLPYLFYELFATTDDRSQYVYLSDGGHFENLGIYELVRRQCPYIIACDADADEGLAFNDLGNAIRKCRSDFGVEIDLRLDTLKPEKDSPYSQAHCVLGDIHYPNRAEPGKLLYIKASLTGEEPQDVLAYKVAHPEFPHQTTAEQWFDESQFESYRALGRFIVESALEALGDRDEIAQKTTEELFEALGARYPPS